MTTEHQTQAHIQNGLLIATALELVRSNAKRSASLLGRAGRFFGAFIAGTIASAALEKMFEGMRPKQPSKELSGDQPATPALTSDIAAGTTQEKTWADDVKRDPSCGCPLRGN
jgi:hypothetical protein